MRMKFAQQEEILVENNKTAEETFKDFRTEVSEELRTKFAEQDRKITEHNRTAEDAVQNFQTEVRDELQKKTAEQENIANNVRVLLNVLARRKHNLSGT